MISAGISKETRKRVYRRDGYRCALCDSPKYIQIHHVVKRSLGGTDSEQNLITLCADCHALAHDMVLRDYQAPYGMRLTAQGNQEDCGKPCGRSGSRTRETWYVLTERWKKQWNSPHFWPVMWTKFQPRNEKPCVSP